MKKIRKEF